MALNIIAQSPGVFPMIPTVSRDGAKEIRPYREILPYEGLKPHTPQNAAGRRTEPPVSEPIAMGA